MAEWIDVNERLPEPKKLVLALVHQLFHRPNVMTIRLTEFAGDKFFTDIYGRKVFNVSHWMPLPEPPKGKDINVPTK